MNDFNPVLALIAEAEQQVATAGLASQFLNKLNESLLEELVTRVAGSVKARIEHYAAAELAATGIGELSAKRHKLGLVVNQVAHQLLGINCRQSDVSKSVRSYFQPVGCVLAVTPLTNPIPNAMFHILNCLRTRNSLLLSFPRAARALGEELVAEVQQLLEQQGLPTGCVQSLPADLDRTGLQTCMQLDGVKLIMAAGGASLVSACQSSGKPVYGVGPGNAPCLVDASTDLATAAQHIVASKAYDNGIICGSENNLVVEQTVAQVFTQALVKAGAYCLQPEETKRARAEWFDQRQQLKSEYIGQSCMRLAKAVDIDVPPDCRLLLVPVDESERLFWCREKLAPLLALVSAPPDQLIDVCEQLIALGGAGHTAAIHSDNAKLIDTFASRISAGRIIVNGPATFGMMGLNTAVPLSFLVGGGSAGNNISTDNITWHHYLNNNRCLWIKSENPTGWN